MSSRIPGFYRLPPEARLSTIEERLGLRREQLDSYSEKGLDINLANSMIENVVGTFALPVGMGINFLINNKDVVVPMVVEEPSVVAAVSNMARLSRTGGGFWAESDPSIMIGQIQVLTDSPDATAKKLEAGLPQLLESTKGLYPRLEERGGGLRGFDIRCVDYDEPGETPESYVVVHVYLDCVDAMGANMVNTLVEKLAPEVSRIAGKSTGLRILSNLADKRLARAHVALRPEHLDHGDISGEEVAEGIAAAYRFAYADPYRAATHNKGVMNGIDAVAVATGNDWRAIEAGAHAYAARSGQYRPMTSWKIDEHGTLHGRIEVPIQVGVVGGPIKVHPTVQANLEVLGTDRAHHLAEVMAAVGLAQNLGALRALSTEGIQQGHMRMHARSIAATAGATPAESPSVVEKLCETKDYSVERACEILEELRNR